MAKKILKILQGGNGRIFSENRAQGITNFPQGGVGLDRVQNRDHKVARACGRLLEIGQDLGIEPIPGAAPTEQLTITAKARPNSEVEVT